MPDPVPSPKPYSIPTQLESSNSAFQVNLLNVIHSTASKLAKALVSNCVFSRSGMDASKAKCLTCITLFPNEVGALENMRSFRRAKLPAGSVRHLYQLAKKKKGEIQYGIQCESHRVEIANRINTGAISSFSELWKAARNSIYEIRNQQAKRDLPEFNTRRTAHSADENQCICFTPWGNNYLHIAHQLVNQLLNSHPVLQLPEKDFRTPVQIGEFQLGPVEFDSSRINLTLALSGKPDPVLNLAPVPLTQFCIHFDKQLLNLPPNSPELEKAIRLSITERPVLKWETQYVEALTKAPKITHTSALHLEHCELQLNHMFKQLQEPDEQPEASLNLLARIYWWSAHAMFDVRGSAAKTELLFRALCKAKSLNLPPWKAGVSADLLCMSMNESSWLQEFRHHLAVYQ